MLGGLLNRLRKRRAARVAPVAQNVGPDRDEDLAALCRLLGEYEGLRLKPYQDSVGVWTIGYGAIYTQGNRRVTANTKPITEATAQRMLRRDAAKRYDRIVKKLRPNASQGARLAFSSLAFNMGAGRIIKSEAMRFYNAGHMATAEMHYKQWRKAGGRILQGLVNRRAKEWALIARDEL